MTTAKHRREEDLVEVVEPPRKKSKKDKSTSDTSKPKKGKEKKAKPEKRSDVEVTDTPVEEVKKGKTDKEKKKAKKTKEKVVDDNIVDAASVEEPAAEATPESAPEEPQPEFKISKNGKKSKKDKKKEKKEKKAKEIGGNVGDEDLAGTPAEEPTPEAEPDTEEPTKKSKKDKKEKKSKKEKTRSELNGMSNGTSAAGYEETPALKSLLESEITSFLTKHDIVISNHESFPSLRPIISFSHLPSTDMLSKSPFASFTTPTPIQATSWPYGLSGRDIIGIAETGSGKTMAFALPCVEAVISGVRTGPGTRKTTRAVIVSPTRELAMQTHEQVSKLCGLVGLNCVCIYGGASKDDQRRELKKGAAVVVATPGRLKDFLHDGDIDLSSAAFAVLDEADRMLDKGFEDDIKLILSSCPPRERRQTLMFTATWPTSVQALASTFMVSPVKITIGKGAASDDDEVKLQANARIKQEVEVVDPRGKERRALEIIKQQGRNERILVFCLYKKEAVRVETFLQQRGVRVCSIHGDLRQDQRTRALEEFKSGKTPVLVATDVAARGLDIPEVKLVLNVTFPLTIEDYVHRIGRTGRAGKDGHAITLFTEHDKAHSGSLINVLKAANQPVPDELLKFGTTVKKKGHDSYGAFFKNVDMNKKATKITFD